SNYGRCRSAVFSERLRRAHLVAPSGPLDCEPRISAACLHRGTPTNFSTSRREGSAPGSGCQPWLTSPICQPLRTLPRFAGRLLREVDALARAYGWREPDILALTPWRRDAYLQLVNA